MIDAQSEQLLTLTQAAKSLPGRPHVATLWRWRKRGIRGVTLETVVIGGRRYTSQEALQRFIDATTSVADGQQPSGQRRTQRQRQAAIRRAERELTAAGI